MICRQETFDNLQSLSWVTLPSCVQQLGLYSGTAMPVIRRIFVILLLASQLVQLDSAKPSVDISLLEVHSTMDNNQRNSKVDSTVEKFRPTVDQIISDFLNGSEKGKTYDELALFTDTFGPRLVGSKALENAIDSLKVLADTAGLETTVDNVDVPVWERVHESCDVIVPARTKQISIVALGNSASTPPDGITAPVILVSSFDELHKVSAQVAGKVLVFRPTWEGYDTYWQYRVEGPIAAQKYGAVAVLIRSATSFSLYSPHAGVTSKNTTIPAASLTVEDADYISRWLKRGAQVRVKLNIQVKRSQGVSRNLFVDFKGSEFPNEYVIISGHSDSWDLGDGALDDATGVFLSWKAIHYLKSKNLRPKRTLRAIYWTSEENSFYGVNAFIKQHSGELGNISIAMEADHGAFDPVGLSFSGTNPKAQREMKDMMSLLRATGATRVSMRIDGSDIVKLQPYGVPVSSLDSKNEKYFYYHHTKADTVTLLKTEELDKCAAVWTSMAYMLSSLDHMLPR